MNYENETNFQLNKRLLELVWSGDAITEIYQHKLGKKLKTFSHAMFKTCGSNEEFKVNYCTDWSVTMPLAIEHGVELSPRYNGWWFAGVVESYTCEEDPLSFAGVTICECPLRAIVICLIKKLESKK
jgi:hypothetical protein